MGEDEYAEMTPEEYMQYVAQERARMAQQQAEGEDQGDEDDEIGLTEDQLEELQQAFDACD